MIKMKCVNGHQKGEVTHKSTRSSSNVDVREGMLVKEIEEKNHCDLSNISDGTILFITHEKIIFIIRISISACAKHVCCA